MDSVYQLFDGIYLSWDPSMFKHQLSFHGYAKDDYTTARECRLT